MNDFPLSMEKWESILKKLIEEPIKEEQIERATEISSILEKLEKHKYYPKKNYLNISDRYYFPREEIRGACQRYIYRQYQDSILYSCFSIEVGLIARLDEIMNEEDKNNIVKNKKPLTLYNLIKKALKYNILNKENKKFAYQLLEMRNIHIHAVNFVSPLLSTYQRIASNVDLSNMDEIKFKEQLKRFDKYTPGFSEFVLKKYEIKDILQAYVSVNKLPTFSWAANQEYLKLIEKETEEILRNMVGALFQGDFDAINDFFNDYVLRKRSLEALKLAEIILTEIEIL